MSTADNSGEETGSSAPSALTIPISDAHQHVDFGPYSVDTAKGLAGLRSDFERRTTVMRESNITRSVLMPSYDYDKRFGLESTQRVIDGLAQYQEWDPAMFPWLGFTVEPQFFDGARDQLRKTLDQGKFRIVSWHNRNQGLPVDARIMFDFVETASNYNCAVFLHATGNLDNEEAWRVARVVKAFPETKFVVLDSLMNFASMQILVELSKEADNFWIDTAGATSFIHTMKGMVDQLSWERVVFGSDFYSDGRGGTPLMMRQQLDHCHLSGHQIEGVCGGNLLSILEP